MREIPFEKENLQIFETRLKFIKVILKRRWRVSLQWK